MIRESLWNHNLKALTQVENTLLQSKSVVVVQPTGSGKSGIMFGLIESMSEAKKILIVEPYTSIEHAHRSSALWSPELDKKVRYITYKYLGDIRDLSDSDLRTEGLCNLDLIILDEVHHVGAPLWLLGFKRLKDGNSLAKILGMTATPVRYLDGAVNVA